VGLVLRQTITRVDQTIAYLRGFIASQFAGSEERTIDIRLKPVAAAR